ncbi:MAG: hypothetical protein ACO1NW_04960 [Chitinophagaceae bacterium]
MPEELSINKYLPIAFIYFFVNSFLLPNGLLYTTLLTPVFLLWIAHFKKTPVVIAAYFTILSPFVIAHFINGVDAKAYLVSFSLFFTTFIFALTFYFFLKKTTSIRLLYKSLLLLNIVFVILAIITLFIPRLTSYFWTDANISANIEGVYRLKLLTYEPSYYSTLLTPIALYYYLKALRRSLPNPIVIIILISVPLILSFSMGVIIALLAAVSLTLIIKPTHFIARKDIPRYLLGGGVVLATLILVSLVIPSENILLQRINNVFSGNDTSFRGRTSEAFTLAWEVAGLKSHFWGCGLGQTKILGPALWEAMYHYKFTPAAIAIPNATADTLAVFGVAGVTLRIGIQIYLFFKTKVYQNLYRFALFFFMFIYQLTGSFIYNIAEYVIWLIAFSSAFEEFNTKPTPSD